MKKAATVGPLDTGGYRIGLLINETAYAPQNRGSRFQRIDA